jgi:hypothetical protein
MLERAVAAAKTAGDDLYVCLYGSNLASALNLAIKPVKTSRIKDAAEQVAAALDAARPWLPRFHRQRFLSSESLIKALPVGYKELTFSFYSAVNETGWWEQGLQGPARACISKIIYPKDPPQRTCGAYGATSRELMACSGCRSTFYCGVLCQARCSLSFVALCAAPGVVYSKILTITCLSHAETALEASHGRVQGAAGQGGRREG